MFNCYVFLARSGHRLSVPGHIVLKRIVTQEKEVAGEQRNVHNLQHYI
jgi:hypothetical protein